MHRNALTDRDITRHWGIPATSPARTLTDLAGYEVDRPPQRRRPVEAGLKVVRVTWERLTLQPNREAARFRTLLSES